jgi:hypothetical protein
MTLQPRDRKALLILGAAVIAFTIVNFAWPDGSKPIVVGAAGSIPTAEKRLDRLRQIAAGLPGKQEALKRVSAELAAREKAVIQAATAAQAQAQLLETLRRIARAQTPPLDLRNLEPRQIRPLGDDYGEVQAGATFECKIEQLVQVLADITAQPELMALDDLRVNMANQKQKTVLARLTISGIVPRKLVPEKKGFGSF